MRSAARRYRALFAAPDVPRVALTSLVGRLPTGMSMLLFVLVVHAGTGSYPVASFAAAANAALTAATGPVLGRLADRGHAVPVLIGTGLAQAAALVALVVALRAGLPVPVVIALAGTAGAVNPPVGAVTRTLLPRLAPGDQARATAFAVDAITLELTFVIGPALVGVVSALWSGYVATLVAAALAALGSVGLATSGAVRRRYPAAPPGDAGARWARRLIGPLHIPGLRTVLLVGGLEAAAYGVLEVAIPAYTNAHGMPQAGGLLFAVWSAGSILGGLWYGGRDFRATLGRQYAVLMGLNIVGFGSVLLARGPYSLGALLFLAGLVIAPTTAVESALVTTLAPRHAVTEALTWSGTSIYLGFAGGSALSGVALSSSLGSATALSTAALLATGLIVAGTLLLVAGRRGLAAPAPPADRAPRRHDDDPAIRESDGPVARDRDDPVAVRESALR